jgi:hypothetical protein
MVRIMWEVKLPEEVHFWEMVVLSLGLGVVSLWFMWKGVEGGVVRQWKGTKEKEEIWSKNRPIPTGG